MLRRLASSSEGRNAYILNSKGPSETLSERLRDAHFLKRKSKKPRLHEPALRQKPSPDRLGDRPTSSTPKAHLLALSVCEAFSYDASHAVASRRLAFTYIPVLSKLGGPHHNSNPLSQAHMLC